MEKADEFPDKPYRENMLSNSVNDVTTVVKNRTCENKQHITSEASNMESMSSGYNTLSENAESKVNMRTSDVLGKSENVEVPTKLSSSGDFSIKDHSLIRNCHTNKASHMNKFSFNDPRGLECCDEPKRLSTSVIQNTVPSASTDSLLTQGCEKVVPLQTASESMDFEFDVEGSQYHSSRQSKNNDPITRVCLGSLSSELSSHHSGLIEDCSSGDAHNHTQLRNIGSTFSDAPCGRLLADNSTSKNLIESCSHFHAKLPGHAGDHLGCDREKSSSHSSDEFENSKVSVGNQKEIVTLCQKKEVGTNSDGGNLPEEPSKPPEQGLEGETVGHIPATLDVKEMPLKCHHTDDSDESDLVEHDVKVCDICGDAGREDLLAICCRCIDGAEHTYCMREMIDEVPKGDWLCEECKLDEENKNTNRQKHDEEAGAEKDQSSRQADTEPASTFIKPDGKGSAVEEPRTSKDLSVVKVTGKRRAEESEFPSAVKKQALEMITGSPRTSSPTRQHAHTDSSIKDVDCGKLKCSHQFSSGSLFGNDSPEAACPPAAGPRLQSLRGAFLKSNSFNFTNARPKTKLVDEIALQRQKSTKEAASCDTIGVREIGKSMSFRSTNSGRYGASDSKVKMLSPKSSHVQDLKSLKNKKERNFERNNSVKSHLVGNLTTSSSTALTPKYDKLQVSRGETALLSSACNHEVKPLKGDSKTIAGLKSTSRTTNIGAEVSVSLANKQLPSSPSGVGTASSNGIISSVEQKPTALKDDNSSELAISKESTNLADGIKEGTTTSLLGLGLIPGTSGVSCQKYKQTGHSAQTYTIDSPGSFGLNVSAVRSSKEVKNRDNKLKDAIEAALLKKPGIYRKNKVPEQSDGSSVLSMNNEVAILDRMPNSSIAGSLTSVEVLTDWQGKTSRNSSGDYGNNFKQSMILPAEGITSRIDDSLLVPSEGKHPTTELSSHDSVALSSLLKIPAIPDHEYIWQGSFEINRSGKTAEFWDGLQAHLSTCASPRVFEAVNKLPHKILLNGVSRISAWPAQFENSGAKEDNIALYFFAKDVESYEKSYQVLLEDMMRGDLALIGSIDGVELLIFPSNQLPEKSHRWNMLFFLWGVFRGKKKNSLHQVPDSPEKCCIPQVASSISTDKMSLLEDVCSQGSIDKDRHVDSEFKGDLKSRTFLQERAVDSIVSRLDNVNAVPASSGEIISFRDVTYGNVSVQIKSDTKDAVKCSRNLNVEEGPFVTEVPAEELNHLQCEPRKRAFVDLSEDVDTSHIKMWRDASSPMVEEASGSKKQKSGSYGQNIRSGNIVNRGCALKEKQCEVEESGAGYSKGERYFFPVDPSPACEMKDVGLGETESFIPLIGASSFSDSRGRTPNLELALGAEDISCLVVNTDKRIITRKEEEDDVSSSLSLSLSFSPADKGKEDRGNRCSTPSMILFRDIADE